MTARPLDPDTLNDRLGARLDPDRLGWLHRAIDEVRADADTIRTRFPAVSRALGRELLDDGAEVDDPFAPTVDDAGRVALVAVLAPADQAAELPGLYQHGDARERRGALRALDVILSPDSPGHAADDAVTATGRLLVEDALRTNDTRLVAAALGPGGVSLLDDTAFAQAVLKCVFVGVDLPSIAGLERRVTPDLSRMMADFVHERIAAGRDVPASVWPVIDAHPPAAQLAAIEAEMGHAVARRADAARAALAKRR